jgi:hypothetical protein
LRLSIGVSPWNIGDDYAASGWRASGRTCRAGDQFWRILAADLGLRSGQRRAAHRPEYCKLPHMIVTFRTKAHADIVMFGDVAVELLKLAGHSGTVPSAIPAEDLQETIARLEAGLAQRHALPEDEEGGERGDDADVEPAVPLSRRAYPLLQLLRAADKAGADVMILASK